MYTVNFMQVPANKNEIQDQYLLKEQDTGL